MTGKLGPLLYGWTFLDTDIIDIYAYPRSVHRNIIYLKSNSNLYLRSSEPEDIQEFGSDPIFISSDVKSICRSNYNVGFIKKDQKAYYSDLNGVVLIGTGLTKAYILRGSSVLLQTDGRLILAHQDSNGNVNQVVIATNVIDFHLTERGENITALAYLTANRDIYIGGLILFYIKVFNSELFGKLLNLFQDEEWATIRQILIQAKDRFPTLNVDDFTDEELKSYLIKLPVDARKIFVSVLPMKILDLATYQSLLSPIYWTSNVVDFDISANNIFTVKTVNGKLNDRKYV